ncbi:hypothetical protein [Thermus antranikianii]|uniref:hypothetical protein n=1 Tax=Thermus antranikianii TaxID=88190 RepID=UPI001C77C060|nr:hypothetical protein [Thermus antranikianii]QWK20796.1 MAG: hypothetical protein KNN15_06900 [Thermus antranikianii]
MAELRDWLLPPWFARDGVNGAVLEAFARGLSATEPEAAARLLYLLEAEGEYLDLHGEVYGIPRLKGESDEEYRRRIIAEIRTPGPRRRPSRPPSRPLSESRPPW